MEVTGTRSPRRPVFSSLKLRFQLGIAFAAFLLLTVAAVTAVTYARFSAHLLDATKAELTSLVALAALDVDTGAHAALTRPEDERTPAYLAVQKRLREIRDSVGVRFVYTLRAAPDGSVVFVVDAEEDPQVSHLGDVYTDAPPTLEAGLAAGPEERDTRRADEIGELSRSAGRLAASMRRVFGELGTGIGTLASSSSGVLAVSDDTAAGARESTARSQAVAAAAERTSASAVSVAAGMEQASTRLASVAAATEELVATITEIAASTERVRRTTDDAGRRAESFAGLVQGLRNAAQEIGKVTGTISSISAQTNLLALNATIEAARAGQAGKGFAVVAGEVKELARQSAAATGDIRTRVESIQSAVSAALEDIESIVAVIREVSGFVASNAAAIEEQSVVTREVATNVAQAAAGVSEASRRAGEMAGASQAIAADIASVSGTAAKLTGASSTLQQSARELSSLAEAIGAILGRFQV